MRRNLISRFTSISLILCLCLSLTIGSDCETNAKKKASIRNKSFTLTMGQKKTIKIKNKIKKAKYSFKSSNKKIASVSSKGVVKGLKKGTTKITVYEKKSKKRRVGMVKISVKSKKVATTNEALTPVQIPITTSTPATLGEYDNPTGFDKAKTGVTYGTMSTVEYSSTTTSKTRKAKVILPPNYTTSKKYPVLYLLHGIGGDENEWLGGNPNYVVNNLVAQNEAKEMIIVLPNVRARANDTANPSDIYSLGHYQAFDNFINDLRDDLMPFIASKYSIATGRENTAIAGLSMGGRESLYIGFTMPETFGYIGAFCPAPGILPYTLNDVTEPGLFNEDSFKLSDTYNRNTLVMITIGASDNVVSNNPTRYHNTLTKNGTEHICFTRPGGHDFTVWKSGLYNFAKRIFQ